MKPTTLLLSIPLVMMMGASHAADDYPELKPGLWSSSQSVSGSKAPVMSGKMCASKEVFDTYKNISKDPNRPCKALSQNHVGSTYSAVTECNFQGRVTHSTSKMVVTGDTGVHIEVQSDDGKVVAIDMQYLGACAAGMVPGDFVTSTGMKINVLTGTAAAH